MIPAIKPPKTYALDRRVTGIGNNKFRYPVVRDAELEISNAVRWTVLNNSFSKTLPLRIVSFLYKNLAFDLWIL